jgi:hypothetical protein
MMSGRNSKRTSAKLGQTSRNGLQNTPQAVSRKPTVDVMDSKLESNFDFKDSEVESEEEMESDDEDITLKEIQSDAEPLEFAMRLQEAHNQMVN